VEYNVIFGQEPEMNDTNGNKPADSMINQIITASISLLGGGVIGILTTVFAAPYVTEKFQLRRQYFIPFRQWCTEMYGVIMEFKHMYEDINSNAKYDNANYVIFHLWYIHKSVEEGYKWLGKVKKDNKDVASSFHCIFDQIDSVWHRVELEHPEAVPLESSAESLRMQLKFLSRNKQNQIQDLIQSRMKEEPKEKKEEKCKDVINNCKEIIWYLEKQIPGSYFFSFRQCQPDDDKHFETARSNLEPL
jgi:hypothetical protein